MATPKTKVVEAEEAFPAPPAEGGSFGSDEYIRAAAPPPAGPASETDLPALPEE
jgi:hypothetical protein